MNVEAIKYTRSCTVIRRQGRYIIEILHEFFENVAVFKYFETAINNQNYIYEKVKCTVISEIICQYSIQKIYIHVHYRKTSD
jgi:hypothetical protein